MRLNYILFIFNIILYLSLNSMINFYVAVFFGIIIILEEIYIKAIKIDSAELIRINKLHKKADEEMLRKIAELDNVKHVEGDRDE